MMTASTRLGRIEKHNLYLRRIHYLYQALGKLDAARALAIAEKLSDITALALTKLDFRLNAARCGEAAVRNHWKDDIRVTQERLDWMLDGTFDQSDIADRIARELLSGIDFSNVSDEELDQMIKDAERADAQQGKR